MSVGDSLLWPRDNLYPLKLALTSPTSGGRSVGIVRACGLKPRSLFLLYILRNTLTIVLGVFNLNDYICLQGLTVQTLWSRDLS
jgi:hypothetical protein